MYGQTSFDASKSSTTPKGFTALLLGLIICYQVVNHIFLHQAVNHEEDEFESDAGCAALPGASGHSSLCMEAQLFQGWHEMPPDSPAELEGMLAISPSAASEPKSSTTSQGPTPDTAETKPALRGDAAEAGQASSRDKPEEVKPEALEGLLWDLAWKMGGGDKSHEAPEKHKKKQNAFMAKASKQKTKKSVTEGLTDLQQKLEAKMKTQARRHAEHRALRALSVAARGQSQEKTPAPRTEWAQSLDDLTHELQAHMEDWRKERADHAAAFAREKKDVAPAKDDVMTPWAHNLDDLTHEIQDHMEARKKERAEHAAAHARAHAARLRAAHAVAKGELSEVESKTPFMSEVDALGRELCQDPSRRNLPACAQFLHPQDSSGSERKASPQNDHENAMAHIKLLEKHLKELEKDRAHDNEEIRKESTGFLRELCADPARHDYPTCVQFFGKPGDASETTAKPASKSLRSSHTKSKAKEVSTDLQPHTLHWTAMNESQVLQDLHHHVGASQLVMQRQELRGAHWEGKIPKVACITVLPQGQVTENLMKYFMDNFNLQHYDGERELVLVYHRNDKEAERIAHLYADGTSVKAAVAHGETEFPSATAYRYGAWVARDADLVARWDFEAWHHPNRLSMQIRAIILSKRPASLVPMVTAFDGDGKKGTVAGGVGPHGSMMGDKTWMQKHWMPLLEEENAVAHGLHSSDLVQVDMPELLAYHDITMLGSASLS